MKVIVEGQRKQLKRASRRHFFLTPLLTQSLRVSFGWSYDILTTTLRKCGIDYQLR